MSMETPQKGSKKEIVEERAKNDWDMLRGGAGVTETGSIDPTKSQLDQARKEMDVDLFLKGPFNPEEQRCLDEAMTTGNLSIDQVRRSLLYSSFDHEYPNLHEWQAIVPTGSRDIEYFMLTYREGEYIYGTDKVQVVSESDEHVKVAVALKKLYDVFSKSRKSK